MDIMKIGPRTILTDGNGAPVLVTLMMRESTTAPARVKAILAVGVVDDDGAKGVVMPFAAAGRKATPEFRLEMN